MKLFWLVDEVFEISKLLSWQNFHPKSPSVRIEPCYCGFFCLHVHIVATTCEMTGQGTESLF